MIPNNYHYLGSYNGHLVWKKSQHLGKWKQRELRILHDILFCTSRYLTSFVPSFQIDVHDVHKLTIYDREFIEGISLIPMKVEYTRVTLFANRQSLAINLFLAMVHKKVKTLGLYGYRKMSIYKSDLKVLVYCGRSFRVYRCVDKQDKQYQLEYMVYSEKYLMCVMKKDGLMSVSWKVKLEGLKRLSTRFGFFDGCLIVNLTYVGGSCYFALPYNSEELVEVLKMVTRSTSAMIDF